MVQLCRWAVVHWIRFKNERTAETLDFSPRPEGCASWKFGPDTTAASISRSGADIWCGIASFHDRAHSDAAFDRPELYLPDLGDADEYWRALLLPVAYHGECNHLDPAAPGPMFEAEKDPGGPLFVMTTAGFNLRSRSDFLRLLDFRRRVDRMRPIIKAADGNAAHQVFAPHTAGDDGVTMSLWRDEKSMLSFAYWSGSHRMEVDRQRSEQTVDRSSFTRFRLVRTAGEWEGLDPMGALPGSQVLPGQSALR